MAYVPVPKDLSRIKTKVAFNLTKRQLIFFADCRFSFYSKTARGQVLRRS